MKNILKVVNKDMPENDEFWTWKPLHKMNVNEWESLCDGCGYCCLHKLQNEEDDSIYITNIACELLDLDTCQCADYENRLTCVPMCQKITVENIASLSWLPDTCAYRCIAEGRSLPEWHPLVTHNKKSPIEAGVLINSFAISESYVHPEQWQDCIIKKVE